MTENDVTVTGRGGHPEINSLINQYFDRDGGTLQDLTQDETALLLFAAVSELREFNNKDENLGELPEETDGSVGQDKSETKEINTEWEKWDVGFTYTEVDLRGFTEPIEVVFGKDVGNAGDRHIYRPSDAPVVGIPAESDYVSVRVFDDTGHPIVSAAQNTNDAVIIDVWEDD